MNEVVVTLKNPITFGDEIIESLTFKGPLKAKHMKGIPLKMTYDDIFTIASRLCAHPPSVIVEVAGEDLTKVLSVVTDFLPAGPKTGD